MKKTVFMSSLAVLTILVVTQKCEAMFSNNAMKEAMQHPCIRACVKHYARQCIDQCQQPTQRPVCPPTGDYYIKPEDRMQVDEKEYIPWGQQESLIQRQPNPFDQ